MKHYDADGELEYVDGPGYCSDCDREWKAKGEAHCSDCCNHFTSDSGFDLHRKDGVCRDPKTVRGIKSGRLLFEATDRASGPTWQMAGDGSSHWLSKPRLEESQPSGEVSGPEVPQSDSQRLSA